MGTKKKDIKHRKLYIDPDDDEIKWTEEELNEEIDWEDGEYEFDVYEHVGTAIICVDHEPIVTIKEIRK